MSTISTNASSGSALRVNDPVITNIIQGYVQADGIAPFVAPVIPVSTRSGKVITFGKEQFAVLNLTRAPGGNIQRLSTAFGTRPYYLAQDAIGAEVPEEQYQEAKNGAAKLDLRKFAVQRALAAATQSWEYRVTQAITDSTQYEPTNVAALTGTSQFSDPDSDPEKLVQDWQDIIRSQVGVYANSAVIGPAVFRALRRHPIFRDRIKYTSAGSVNLDMIAAWLNLPRGIKVNMRVKLAANGSLEDLFANHMVLFYSPEGGIGEGFKPLSYSDQATPAFAYTYSLNGYPIGGVERFDEDRRVYVTDVITEQSLQLVGQGQTGKVGAAFLALNASTL